MEKPVFNGQFCEECGDELYWNKTKKTCQKCLMN